MRRSGPVVDEADLLALADLIGAATPGLSSRDRAVLDVADRLHAARAHRRG